MKPVKALVSVVIATVGMDGKIIDYEITCAREIPFTDGSDCQKLYADFIKDVCNEEV